MGIFKRRQPRWLINVPEPPREHLEAPILHANDLVRVIGTTSNQHLLRRIASRGWDHSRYARELHGRALEWAEANENPTWFRAALLRERGDPEAVSVYADGIGPVGRLSVADGRKYQAVMDEIRKRDSKAGCCPAFLTGGEFGKPFGAMLCLSAPEIVIAHLDDDDFSD